MGSFFEGVNTGVTEPQELLDLWIKPLRERGIGISMDGKGRCLDNVFVERLWRSLRYEEVYLHAYGDVAEARARPPPDLLHDERAHQALGYQTPASFYARETSKAAA